MKFLSILLFTVVSFTVCYSQAPEKSTPFTAVKWEGEKPVIRFENEWYSFIRFEKIPVENIIAFAKEKHGSRWQKRFSEDFVELLRTMGENPQIQVKLTLEKNGKTIEKTGTMTTENRRKVWQYNDEQPTADVKKSETQKQITNTNNAFMQAVADATNPTASDGLFSIKSAKIVYHYSGIVNGTDVLWFDDYGKIAVLEQDRKEKTGAIKQTIIWRDKKSTFVNHIRKDVATSPFRPKDTEPPTIATVSEEQRKREGYERKEDESIAGKKCSVWLREKENSKIQYWLWNNVDLKLINHALGSKFGYEKIAVSVEENIKIPASLLETPSGYSVK